MKSRDTRTRHRWVSWNLHPGVSSPPTVFLKITCRWRSLQKVATHASLNTRYWRQHNINVLWAERDSGRIPGNSRFGWDWSKSKQKRKEKRHRDFKWQKVSHKNTGWRVIKLLHKISAENLCKVETLLHLDLTRYHKKRMAEIGIH